MITTYKSYGDIADTQNQSCFILTKTITYYTFILKYYKSEQYLRENVLDPY